MAKKEIPVYKPGWVGVFLYYTGEILNFLFLLIFIPFLATCVTMYNWAVIDESSVPIRLFESSGGVWTWTYQLQSIAVILFLWLFMYMVKQNLNDLFSAKQTALIKIDKKYINHTGHKPGEKSCCIGGGNEYFVITQKAYNCLSVGQTVKIRYTKVQRNVRMIVLVK